MGVAGFLYGSDPHYIDHLAPLCDLFNVPLLVSEEAIEETIRKYYPTVVTYRYEKEEITRKTLHSFEAIFTCLPKAMIDKIFFFDEHLFRKKLLTIWVGHGNSDKGRFTPFMEALQSEKILLVYGQNMIDFLKSKNVLDKVYRHLTIGNFRYHYYKKMEPFYNQIVQKEILSSFRKRSPTILYAPTWGNSSLLTAFEPLLDTLPDSYNLIVKMHPNSLLQSPALRERLQNRSNVLFIHDFPPIYPLLEHVDILLGDFSSINYDFLTFNKPLFFLGESEKTPIRECGACITDFSEIFETIERELPHDKERYSKKRGDLYAYTFAPIAGYDRIKADVLNAIKQYFDEEPHCLS